MKEISLDMSTTCIGWSVWEEDTLVDYGKLKPLDDKIEWRERIQEFIPQLHSIMKKYKPVKAYAEDVPLMRKGGNKILVQLGACQGSLLGLCYSHNVEVEFIEVGKWRKNIGISCGETDRDNMKIKSIETANKLFNLNLNCCFTKNGNYCSAKSDDDISDAILIYASTRKKYQKCVSFGRINNG